MRRRERFGPFERGPAGLTRALRVEGQTPLVVLPLGPHEMPVLLPTLPRSGLRLPPPMPSADFCAAVSASPDALSPAVGTRRRPPAISSTAVRTRPPNLRSASLMDLGFAVSCPLARRSRLVSGFCSSARAFAPRFLQTPRRRDALAVRYPSPPSGWERTCTPKLSNMRGVQEKARLV